MRYEITLTTDAPQHEAEEDGRGWRSTSTGIGKAREIEVEMSDASDISRARFVADAQAYLAPGERLELERAHVRSHVRSHMRCSRS